VTVTVKALVETLDVQVVHGTGNNFLEHGEHDGRKFIWQNRRKVVPNGVDPAKDKVVVPIRKTLSLVEPILGLLFVKLGD
jgi:hypothetical protein